MESTTVFIFLMYRGHQLGIPKGSFLILYFYKLVHNYCTDNKLVHN